MHLALRKLTVEYFLLVNGKIVTQEKKQLFFHKIDLANRKHLCVRAPVLVLWGRVVKVLGRDDKGREEDPMTRARHA